MNDPHVLNPADIPAIALPSMDATHHEEVALVNHIGALIKGGQSESGALDSEQLQSQLDEWVGHTRAHFDTENQLMAAAHFPAYSLHSAAHTQALEGLIASVEAWQADKNLDALANYVFKLWPEWFLMHVSSMDAMTALYLSQQRRGDG